jgi:hypothetical protein
MTTESLRALIRGSDARMTGEYLTAGIVALGILLALLI